MSRFVPATLMLAVVLVAGLTACSNGSDNSKDSASRPMPAAPAGDTPTDTDPLADIPENIPDYSGMTVFPKEFPCGLSTTDTYTYEARIEREIRDCIIMSMPTDGLLIQGMNIGFGSIASFDIYDADMYIAWQDEMDAAGIDTTYRAYTDALMITYECKPSSDTPGYNIACRAWDNALKYYTGDMEVILEE